MILVHKYSVIQIMACIVIKQLLCVNAKATCKNNLNYNIKKYRFNNFNTKLCSLAQTNYVEICDH